LERYLTNRMSKHRDFDRIYDDRDVDIYNYYLEETQKHKIYDIDWTTILEIQNKDVGKILQTNSTLNKTYEKKFLSEHNIYLQKKRKESLY